MTNPNRYAVPLEQLDDVRVASTEQVEEQATAASGDTGSWAGALPPAFGDGGGHDGDGD